MPTFASPLFLAVFGGVIIGNLLPRGSRLQPGFRFAATWLLRIGVVLLGLRISLSDLLSIGAKGLLVVVITVAVTFLGAQWLGRRLGVRPDLALLVGTGYAICGVSAVTAMNGVIRADEEEAAYAIGLVTLAGSLSIVILPIFGQVLGLDPAEFGTWVGGAVHDVAQTIATASTSTEELEGIPNRRPPILPWFVVGFLAFVALRSTGWLNEDIIGTVRAVEGWLFVIALVGVGAGVDISRLRQLGGRPLQLGMLTWVLVAGISYLGVALVN
ncbi:MAG: putative sulfate exporter family transporter [Actinobacteria bacterium]|nr:putative sulfate exporter family transporter [Actinomycetota bacterium]